jgi:hypothetical protein
MAEENNTDKVETEDKTLEDQLAALEEVAASLEEDTEIKSDHSAEDCEDDDCEEHGTKDASGEDAPAEDMEEKVAAAVEEVLAEGDTADEKAITRQHPVSTGYPYDRVEMQPGAPEFDEEEDEKNEVPAKRRVVVVEMDPSEITDDMKAYVVEVPDGEDEPPPFIPADEEPKAYVPIPGDEEESLPRPTDAPPPMRDAPPPMGDRDAPRPMRAVPAEVAPDPSPMRNPSPMTPVGAGLEAPPFIPNDEDDDGKGWGKKPGKNRLARLMALANGDDPDEEEEDEKVTVPSYPTAVFVGKEDAEPMTVMDALDSDALENRLARLDTDSKSLEGGGFLCAIERKILKGDVCNFCRGGCVSEKGLPGLLEVEVSAEKEFSGQVVDSGYAPKDDIFVLDLKTDDGIVEAYYAGNGSSLGWIRLDPEVQEKSADGTDRVIVSFNEAEVEALRNIEGKSLGVDVDIFQGEDAYVVEIDGVDGKSYDAYVSVDGKFLGSDMIELTEEEEDEIKVLREMKESIEAELRLKMAHVSGATGDLIEDGMAMADGSYPIVSGDDLDNAIKASLRSKSQEVRDHIIKRAEEMGKVGHLPTEWSEHKTAQEAEFAASLMELQMLEIETDEKSSE